MPFDIEIDKLTNSIENTITEEVFETIITRVLAIDSKQVKKVDWQFDWHREIKDETREVYKLTTVNNPAIIHGLISLSDKADHIFMDLIESAKFNKGKKKQYHGVAGNRMFIDTRESLALVLRYFKDFEYGKL